MRIISSILLTFTLVLNSLGLVLNEHYCQNERKSVSLFVEAGTCHEVAQAKASCPFHPAMALESTEKHASNNCCHDTSQLLKQVPVQQAQQHSVLLFSLQAAVFPAALVLPAPPEMTQIGEYLNYKPPLLVRDLSICLQTFRC
jgi:hypothetical protein